MNVPIDPRIELAKAAVAARQLAMDAQPLDSGRRAQIWAGVEAARAPRPSGLWWGVGLAATAAAAVCVWQLPAREAPLLERGVLRAGDTLAAGEQVPLDVGLEAGSEATLRGPGYVLRLDGGALVQVRPTELELERGALELSGEGSWTIVTREARIAWVGGHVRVDRRAPATTVEVRTGQVQLSARDGAARTLAAGEAVRVAPAAASSDADTPASADEVRSPATLAAAPSRSPEDARETTKATAKARGSAPRPTPAGAPATSPAGRAVAPATASGVLHASGSRDPSAVSAPSAASAPAPTPRVRDDAAPPAEPGEFSRALDEARRAVAHDAARAQALAEDVIQRAPLRYDVMRGWMVVADVRRRRGDRAGAAAVYGQVAATADAGILREEASYRESQLLAELSRSRDALQSLAAAALLPPPHHLAPERAALAASLHLTLEDAPAAALILEQAAMTDTTVVQRARLDVARALAKSQPARARALAQPVLDSASARLAEEATALLQQLSTGTPK